MKDELKVIFLDIDGVMNSRDREIAKSEALITKYGSQDKIPFWEEIQLDNPDEFHVKWLNHITDITNAQIVISSTWRDEAQNLMWNRFMATLGVRGRIIGCTPRLQTIRGLEIDTWIKCYNDNHANPVDGYRWEGILTSFVILDDDGDMAPHMDRWVWCDNKAGLTEYEAETAIKILEKKL
jgi:hypothetical protein